MKTTDPIISLNSIAIGHRGEHAILRKLGLTVNRGEMVALIGRNGAGKSTLLKSMIGLLPLLEGLCLLDGHPLDEYRLPERALKLSFVSSQLDQLPAITVGELVALGRIPHTGWSGRLGKNDRKLIRQAMEEVQMGGFESRQLDCLSDGERQRALIARALAQDTPLMVLDEPTAFLDIPNTFDLIRILSKSRDNGRSVVYSTHDMDTAMRCADKMWVIHEGRVLEGAPEDLGISGIFNELYAGSGIKYDDQSGSFLFSASKRGSISLEGEKGNALLWTRNMLERLGFRIEKGAPKNLSVQAQAEGYSWVLKNMGATTRHHDLYTLARFLMQE